MGQWEASKKISLWTQTNKQTDGHGDSMTESAQWADSVKTFTVQYSAALVGSHSLI